MKRRIDGTGIYRFLPQNKLSAGFNFLCDLCDCVCAGKHGNGHAFFLFNVHGFYSVLCVRGSG
jgi:hypothetical protein